MFSLRTRKLTIAGILALILLGCGEEWNVNKVFVSKNQSNTLVSLIENAQIAYDKGHFKDALKYAEKAEKLSPHNEQIAVLLGYINLSLSGMDPFKIAKGLVTASKSSNASNDEKNKALLQASSSRATFFFDTLKSVLDLDRQTLKQFGEISKEEKLAAFKNFDILLPKSASEIRSLDEVEVIHRLNQAVKKICPFVNEKLRNVDLDERHNENNCPTTSTIRERKVVSHFLWAFAHIAEAVVFYSVVQYQEEGKDRPNIALRADALQKNSQNLDVSSYAQHTVSLAEAMNSVYAVNDPDSQFTAMITNIALAADTFAAIGKMPTKVKQALIRAVTSINDQRDQMGGESDIEKQGNSFKNQINRMFAIELGRQINAFAQNNPDEFEDNKDSLCRSFDTISGGMTIPAGCK